MEKILGEMFEEGFFSNIFFVNTNPATVSIEKIGKQNGEIKKTVISNTYELTSLTVSDEDDIKYSLLHNFFVTLNYNSNRKELKYFDRGFLKNTFTKKDPNIILDEILEYDWIITSPNIINEITSSSFITTQESDALVKLKGYFTSQFKNTLVFELPPDNINSNLYKQFSKNIIYCGKNNSITPVINRNKKDDKDGIRVEYIFNTSNDLKKIIIM
jgi:hypothetical protein